MNYFVLLLCKNSNFKDTLKIHKHTERRTNKLLDKMTK